MSPHNNTTTTLLLLLFLSLLLTLSTSQQIPQLPPPRFLQKKFKTITNNLKMAYVEVGTGDPIVFLHGNPTSSFLWRNVMPHLEHRGRLIAPDLIGMGDSDKLNPSGPNRYTYLEHSNYLSQLLEQLAVKQNVTLVIHDWGSALGFLWAYRNRFNPNAIKAIVFMEAIVEPIGESATQLSPETGELFNLVRGPAGEQLILQENLFVEQLLPASILRNLTMEEMDEYRRPFRNPGEDRRPTLTWPRQVPINGEPAEVVTIVSAYSKWLREAPFPKLFVDVEPGVLSVLARETVKQWPNLDKVTVRGLHFVQEDSPDEIGRAIAQWLP